MYTGSTSIKKITIMQHTAQKSKYDETVCKRIETDITDGVISKGRTQAEHFSC
jgi:hypothetical protein